MVDHGMPNEVLVEEVRQWLHERGGAKVLVEYMVADHVQLDLKEEAKVRALGLQIVVPCSFSAGHGKWIATSLAQ
jgi:hypothetical protein